MKEIGFGNLVTSAGAVHIPTLLKTYCFPNEPAALSREVLEAPGGNLAYYPARNPSPLPAFGTLPPGKYQPLVSMLDACDSEYGVIWKLGALGSFNHGQSARLPGKKSQEHADTVTSGI
jgi:hypothetical protein